MKDTTKKKKIKKIKKKKETGYQVFVELFLSLENRKWRHVWRT